MFFMFSWFSVFLKPLFSEKNLKVLSLVLCIVRRTKKYDILCVLKSDVDEDHLLQRLMSSLHSVLLSPSSSDSRAWSLSSSGSFSVKSFFYALSKDSNPLMFLPAKFLWSSKVPSKVKALAWIVAHGKVNTNDKLQLRRPYKSLCPQWCILCKGNGE